MPCGSRRAGQEDRPSGQHPRAKHRPAGAQGSGRCPGGGPDQRRGRLRADLPIARYDSLTAADVLEELSGLSQIDLAKVDTYERKNQNRSTVLGRTSALRADEPWPGYDELNASEVNAVLGEGYEDQAKRARDYERSHKNRNTVLQTTERETSNA